MNIATLRSVYGKVKTYYFNPLRGKNGLYPTFVKPVRTNVNGETEMILSDKELSSPDRDYFIPEDKVIEVTDGTTFDLDNPLQRNMWESIKDSHLIAPERSARDDHGVLLIDGDFRRYGLAELYIERPGVESTRRVERTILLTKAYSLIGNDSANHRLTICKLLGKSMVNAPDSDIQDYLYQKAEKDPQAIINMYEDSDQVIRLLLIEAKNKNIITKRSGVYMYSDTALGVTDEAAILFLKDIKNTAIKDSIARETYPDMIGLVPKKPKK